MLKVLKWIGSTIVALVLLFVGAVYVLSSRALGKNYAMPTESGIAIPADSASIARGEHLFKATASCAECHGMDGGGQLMAAEGPFESLAAPNLTRGSGSVVADFAPEDWERAIRHGIRDDGTSLIVMPSEVFAYLTDEDVGAIVAYLGQAPPVDRESPPVTFSFLGRALVGFGKLPLLVADKTPTVQHTASITPDTTAAYGAYLANIGGCRGCHGLQLSGGPTLGPPGTPPASNLTPTGIGHYTKQDFARALREGKRPDGTEISTFMPWRVFAGMTDDEVTALWNYLQTVPPMEFGNR
jgi:cytochrome c553